MPIRLVRLRTATLDEIKEGRRVAADPKKENYDIEELIGNQALAVEVNKLGSEANPIRIHIGLNAGGMSRNGFELTTRSGVVVEEVKKELQGIAGDLKNLKVVGLMTHFPVESRTDDKAGLNLFKTQVKIIDDDPAFSAWKQADRHVANSFATMNVKETHLNMVRVGGALYGDVDDVDYVRTAGGTATAHFERAMTFKSKVASINFYRQGSTVSYGRTRLLTRDSRLANIPVGYSDGYRRDFTNLAYVLIKGHRVPVMGRVTMNTIMVDVTDFIGGADGIVRDSEVVLFGRQGDEEITQDSLEDASDTSGAEFTTVWGQLNPRKLAADSIGTARRK
ncbi:alanine racemase C-terminal domain-containing protein [Chitinimonas koreensis]|nr:alanine racemase C-terminal domain-containing protein [Chitinimonas koreensis]